MSPTLADTISIVLLQGVQGGFYVYRESTNDLSGHPSHLRAILA